MNKSRIVSALKMQNGLYTITMPFKDPETGRPQAPEVVINEVLDTVTTPMYSQFSPWIQEEVMPLKSLRKDERQKDVYILPPHMTITPVIEVYAQPWKPRINAMYGLMMPAYSIYGTAEAMGTIAEYNMLASQMRDKFTTIYLGNNRVRLEAFNCRDIELTIASEHQSNLETLPEGCYDSYMQLATLDVQVFLWNTLKMYNNLPTAFGEVSLKLDQFEQAEAARNELLNQWRDTAHLDKMYYVNFV